MPVGGRVDIGARGQAAAWLAVGEVVLVPALAHDPVAGRRLFGPRPHQLHHLGGRATLVQADAAELDAYLLQMVVAVENAGQNGAAGQVDQARRRPGPGEQRRVGARGHNAAVFDGNRLDGRVARVQGVDASVVENQIWCKVLD